MADLISFENLKSVLDLELKESDYPALAVIRDSVKAAIQSHIGRNLDFGKYTESKLIAYQTKMIGLMGLPVKSVSNVTIDGVAITDYKLRDYGIEISGGIEDQTVAVTYKGGFERLPEDIGRAALIQTVYEYQNKDHMGAESVSSDGGSVSRPALGLLKETTRLLSPYRHVLDKSF